MAERVGFEPTRPLSEPTRFPVVSLQPLGHRSTLTNLYPIRLPTSDARRVHRERVYFGGEPMAGGLQEAVFYGGKPCGTGAH
jgi:hypothetical protein